MNEHDIESRIAAERLESAHFEWQRHDRINRILISGIEGAIQQLQAVVEALRLYGIKSPRQMQADREQQGM